MVTSPTGKGVIVMGGETESEEDSKEMFELSQSLQWTRLEQTLQIEHYWPLAIPIPDELVRVAQSKRSRELSQDNILTSKRRRKNSDRGQSINILYGIRLRRLEVVGEVA